MEPKKYQTNIKSIKIPNLGTLRMRQSILKEINLKLEELTERLKTRLDEDEKTHAEIMLKKFTQLKASGLRLINVEKRKVNNYCKRKNIDFKV